MAIAPMAGGDPLVSRVVGAVPEVRRRGPQCAGEAHHHPQRAQIGCFEKGSAFHEDNGSSGVNCPFSIDWRP